MSNKTDRNTEIKKIFFRINKHNRVKKKNEANTEKFCYSRIVQVYLSKYSLIKRINLKCFAYLPSYVYKIS